MLESIRLQILSADNSTIIIFLMACAILCLGSLYVIFRYFHRSRIIDDTPTSKIRSAHQGFVELEGKGRLMKGTPIVSPMSKIECLWYSYSIERQVGRNSISFGSDDHNPFSNSDWETVEEEVSDNLFLLVDDTGICVIDPDKATITPSFSKTWYGADISSATRGNSASRFSFGSNDYKFTEKRINIGADLYILGRFKTIGGRREILDKKGEVRDLLAKWKTRPDILLTHFDENGDGEIDMQEWQKVMAAAEQEVEKNLSERLVQPEAHTVSKPLDSRRPYIISVESQETIAHRYRWYSRAGILGFFLSGISFVWVLGIRFANLL